eukprot:5806101-Alexandrium_andersonii.AAC.1
MDLDEEEEEEGAHGPVRTDHRDRTRGLGRPQWHPDSPIFGPTAPPAATASWAPEDPRAPDLAALPPARA